MTDPLEEELRRELRAASVHYDADGADAMIRAATTARSRAWVAPVAAAATVVAVGGSVAYFGLHGSSTSPTASGAGNGPACSTASAGWQTMPAASASIFYGGGSPGGGLSNFPSPGTIPNQSDTPAPTDSPSASVPFPSDYPSNVPSIYPSNVPSDYVTMRPACGTDLPGMGSARATYHPLLPPVTLRAAAVRVGKSATYTLPAPAAGKQLGVYSFDTRDTARYVVYLGTLKVGEGSADVQTVTGAGSNAKGDGKHSIRVVITCTAAKDGTCNGTLQVQDV